MTSMTKVRTKKIFNKKIICLIVFIFVSLGIGFLIAKFGEGVSYIEKNAILYLITFFGFSLTATVFIYQSLDSRIEESEQDKAKVLIKSLSRSLVLTLILIVCIIFFDFLTSIVDAKEEGQINWLICLSTIKYAMIIYAIICQFDILYSFVIIMRSYKKK